MFLVFFSAYIAASEIALFSLSRFQLRSLKEHVRVLTQKRIKRLLNDPGGLLITLLVVNEVINIALSSLITGSIASSSTTTGNGAPLSGADWLSFLFEGTAITTLIILFFCEITPKVIGARANMLVATVTAGPLSMIYGVMKPVRFLLTRLVAVVARSVSKQKERPEFGKNMILKESEFLEMVEEGHKEGAIQQSEMDLIKNVFELDNTKVDEILTPIFQVQTLPARTTVREALATMRLRKYSRVPIIDGGLPRKPQVVGILYTKDLLKARLEPGLMETAVTELMRKPPIVQPSMQLNALFRKFKQQRTHMAVVQRANGETIGVVTMSDVLESLFDDLVEPGDEGKD